MSYTNNSGDVPQDSKHPYDIFIPDGLLHQISTSQTVPKDSLNYLQISTERPLPITRIENAPVTVFQSSVAKALLGKGWLALPVYPNDVPNDIYDERKFLGCLQSAGNYGIGTTSEEAHKELLKVLSTTSVESKAESADEQKATSNGKLDDFNDAMRYYMNAFNEIDKRNSQKSVIKEKTLPLKSSNEENFEVNLKMPLTNATKTFFSPAEFRFAEQGEPINVRPLIQIGDDSSRLIKATRKVAYDEPNYDNYDAIRALQQNAIMDECRSNPVLFIEKYVLHRELSTSEKTIVNNLCGSERFQFIRFSKPSDVSNFSISVALWMLIHNNSSVLFYGKRWETMRKKFETMMSAITDWILCKKSDDAGNEIDFTNGSTVHFLEKYGDAECCRNNYDLVIADSEMENLHDFEKDSDMMSKLLITSSVAKNKLNTLSGLKKIKKKLSTMCIVG